MLFRPEEGANAAAGLSFKCVLTASVVWDRKQGGELGGLQSWLCDGCSLPCSVSGISPSTDSVWDWCLLGDSVLQKQRNPALLNYL